MRVEITNLAAVNSGEDNEVYVASSPEDCRDELDRMAYELACEFGNVITIGCVIATPLNNN